MQQEPIQWQDLAAVHHVQQATIRFQKDRVHALNAKQDIIPLWERLVVLSVELAVIQLRVLAAALHAQQDIILHPLGRLHVLNANQGIMPLQEHPAVLSVQQDRFLLQGERVRVLNAK